MYFSWKLSLFWWPLWLATMIVWSSNVATSAISSTDYIKVKLQETKKKWLLNVDEATTSPRENSAGKRANEVPEWTNVWSKASGNKASQPRALRLLNETFIVDEHRVFPVTFDPERANNTREERQLNLASPSQAIKFVKSYYWRGLAFLLVCQTSYCNHYRGYDVASSVDDRQTMEYPGLVPVDASFFEHVDLPHLVIAYAFDDDNPANEIPSSKIYRWDGTHMAYVEDVLVPTPSSVTTFRKAGSTIVLFGLERNPTARGGCLIYELNDNSSIQRVDSLANMDAAASVYPYDYVNQQYLLTINEMGSAEILRWNGVGFDKLMDLPNIQPLADQIRLVRIDDETLLFISDLNALSVYRIENGSVAHLTDLALPNEQRVVEITAWKYEDAVMLLLVKANRDGTFQTELWQLNLRAEQSDNDRSALLRDCLGELKDLLDSRGAAMRDWINAKKSNQTSPLRLDDLIINAGNIDSVEFREQGEPAVADPRQIKEKLLELQASANALKTNAMKNRATLLGNTSFHAGVHFEELHIDALEADRVNGKRANLENYLISGIEQQFATDLKVKRVEVDELRVSSLCGYSVDHWMRVNDSVRISIDNFKDIDRLSIRNDTIVVESDLTMQEVNTASVNGIDLNDFLRSVFTIGSEQTIEGRVRYKGIVHATSLYSDRVNGVASSDLITKPSNQSLTDVFIDSLQVEQLYVKKINGVPVDRAAMVSTENFIKGQVTLTSLIITDELTTKESLVIPLAHSSQEYDQMSIDGDVFVNNLDLDDGAEVSITGDGPDDKPLSVNVRSLVEHSWSKSSDQTIQAPIVRFERGASVDQLDCLYLNGLGERDFLYTDSQELDDLENVTFASFHFNDIVGETSFVEKSNQQLVFRRPVRMRYLSANNVYTDRYNGIPIDAIMRSDVDSHPFTERAQFDSVRVDGRMDVDELRVKRVNRNDVELLGRALRVDSPYVELLSLRGDVLTFDNVNVSKLNGQNLERALARQENWLSNEIQSQISLTIEAEVTIEGGIQVDRINDEEANDYVNRMRDVDPSDLMELQSRDRSTVVERLEVGLLNGQRVDEFFAATLSRAKRQTLNGRVAFTDAQIRYLTADSINTVDLSQLMYTDRPPGVFQANVTFANLYVDGNIQSKTFNGAHASKLRRVLVDNMENLLVQGDIEWGEPSSDPRSLSRLLDDAVNKHEDQLIVGTVSFEKPVIVESLYLRGNNSEILQKISDVISDAVIDNIDDSRPTSVRGTKIFKRGLIVDNLQVDGNIDIKRVNGLDIHRVSSEIFQKDKPEVISADMTFLDRVTIDRLLAKHSIHGVALRQLAVIGEKMPKKLHFQRLLVQGDVLLHKLDGIIFDDFAKRRVTVDEDNEIFVDVVFANPVRVSNATYVTTLNDVIPDNLVQSNADGTPIMVNGNKIFLSTLVVEQRLETPLINGFHVDSIYADAVLNGANASVLGSLVFEEGFEIDGNITVFGQINGCKLERSGEAVSLMHNQLTQDILNKSLSSLDCCSYESDDETTRAVDASVLYLEEEMKLNWHLAGVQSVVKSSWPANDQTRLEIVAEEFDATCRQAQSGCPCRKQYVVDVLPSGEYEVREQTSNKFTYTFYHPEGGYGLKLISERCFNVSNTTEHSQVFWFTFDGHREVLRETPSLLISGYVSDARIVPNGDQLYLIVAIFYNGETNSHATNSLLCLFDWRSEQTVLVQPIITDGAKSINVFQIANVGTHVLIGCVKGKAESLLLRLNATGQLQLIRTFATGGSKYVDSVSSNEQTFVVLNNPDVGALQIFHYDDRSDNFVDYQILFLESRVTSLGVFYSGDLGYSDAFVVTTTKDGWLHIYEYMLYGKFQRKMSYWVDDVHFSTPFRHMSENYLFVGLKFNSTVYKVVQQGYY